MTIVDSCILIDIANSDSYTMKSKEAFLERAKIGKIFAPDIVFAEVCLAFKNKSSAELLFSELDIEVIYPSLGELWKIAQAYQSFKRRNRKTERKQIRSQKRILPDFYIGAIALSQGVPLLTRDVSRRWGLDFPGLIVVTP